MSHKTKSLTMTNWEKPVLFPAEIAYAARDAESGLTIARAMRESEIDKKKKYAGAAVADELEELGDGLARFLAPHVQFVPA
jgi:ribonuclease D